MKDLKPATTFEKYIDVGSNWMGIYILIHIPLALIVGNFRVSQALVGSFSVGVLTMIFYRVIPRKGVRRVLNWITTLTFVVAALYFPD
ncbi:hypothetical protein QP921_08380 [Corynebacterium pseudodiphtheriticum]|uniref:hypothetical protein n=1 Tax=Corynebacterium pseudodiphtheriticum TaxID=37637 RepID=UPI00254BBFBB|nr:hypothetical protein [Corynebacterium pseudodiphtheriticum]MDK8478361.1 hypothetical protein [Corynebacterium pseudodiphtheriticum]MDK8486812.1 hypothetical protein [Corynebacterium pseudodiphtheriticum]MDK8494176.1 hypothetical protein [Corynebacterium pseudodiphtheriticum]MDK8500563.1 hypothetical protein [Corynebacterium pseudodiphtheriticum]MDK8552132.1 hypothetical protein [Corynebacterium pseudodiphtheriticum]